MPSSLRPLLCVQCFQQFRESASRSKEASISIPPRRVRCAHCLIVSTLVNAAPAARLSLTGVQLVDCALQLFKLLSRLAKLAFCGEALVVGEVFGSFRDEGVEISRG